ncbi:hypothetical protein TSOC_000434, partial [Tetrabaena socialis]
PASPPAAQRLPPAGPFTHSQRLARPTAGPARPHPPLPGLRGLAAALGALVGGRTHAAAAGDRWAGTGPAAAGCRAARGRRAAHNRSIAARVDREQLAGDEL